MEDFKAKQRLRKKLYSRGSFIILLSITVLLVRGAWGAWQKQRESGNNLARVEQELSSARGREQELSQSIERIKTPDGVENEIRQKFSVVRPGEEIVLIVNETRNNTDSDSGSPSFIKKIGRWFANLFGEN
jgi:hypothetical protein